MNHPKKLSKKQQQLLIAAQPYQICLSRIEVDSIIDEILKTELHFDANQMTHYGLQLYRRAIKHFLYKYVVNQGQSNMPERHSSLAEDLLTVLMLERDQLNVDADGLIDTLEEIIPEIEYQLKEHFDFYPDDYKPTGYEYLEVRSSSSSYLIICHGDYRILSYHGWIAPCTTSLSLN